MGRATPRPSPLLPPSGCVLSRTLPDHLPAPACLPPYQSAAPGSRCPRRWARAAQAGSSDTHTHDAQNRQRHLAAPPTRRSWTPEAHPVPALRGPPAPPVRPSSFICPATQQLRSAFQRRLRTPKYPLNSSRAPCSRGGGAELKPHVGAFGGPPPKAQARARGPPRIGLSPGLGLGIKTSRWRGIAPCSSRAGWGRPVRKGTTRSRLPPVLSEPVCASHVSQRPRKTLA